MKRGTTLFLKIAVILIGIPILALCIFIVPQVADLAVYTLPNIPFVEYIVFFFLYASAIPFYVALYQAFKLLSLIDKGEAFSQISVSALKNIKYCAMTISSLHVLFLPIVFLMAEVDDAPGLVVIGMGIVFASMVIAVFAAVLQKLLQEAINIKSENDLTV